MVESDANKRLPRMSVRAYGSIKRRLLRYSVGPGKFQSHYIVHTGIGR